MSDAPPVNLDLLLPEDPAAWREWAATLPASVAMGLEPETVEAGRALVRLRESRFPINPNGSVHGGIVLAIADHIGGMAAMTVMPPGEYCATATLNCSFLRPAMLPLVVEAAVSRSGRTLAFVEISVTSGDGRQCASMSGTWSLNLLGAATRAA